jgi:hypothetical protein
VNLGADIFSAASTRDISSFKDKATRAFRDVQNAAINTKGVVRNLFDSLLALTTIDFGSKLASGGLGSLKTVVEKLANDIQAVQNFSFSTPLGGTQQPFKEFLSNSLPGIQGFVEGLGTAAQQTGALGQAIDQAGNFLAGLGPEGTAAAGAVTAAVFAMDSAVRNSFQKGLEDSAEALRQMDAAAQQLLETLSKLGSARPVTELRASLGKAVSAQNETAPGTPENVEATQRVVNLNKELERSLSIQNALQERLAMNDRERAKFLTDLVALSELGARPVQKPQLLLPSTDLLQNQAYQDGRSSQGNFPFRRIEAGQTIAVGADPRSFANLGDLRTRTNDPRTKRAQQQAVEANDVATKEMQSFLDSFASLSKTLGAAVKTNADRLESAERRALTKLVEFSKEVDDAYKKNLQERQRSQEEQEQRRDRAFSEFLSVDREEQIKRQERRANRLSGFKKRFGAATQGALIGGGFPLLFGQGIGPAIGGGLGGIIGGVLGGPGGSFAGSIVGTAVFTALDGLANSANSAAAALQKPIEALNKLVEGKLITSTDANLATTLNGQGQIALAKEIIEQGLRSTGAASLRDPIKAQELRDREFVETQNQQALQKAFGGFDLGREFQKVISFYTGTFDDIRTNFAVETRDEDGNLLTVPNIRPRETLAGASIGNLKRQAVGAQLITQDDYERFLKDQVFEGTVKDSSFLGFGGKTVAKGRAPELAQNFIDLLSEIDPDFASKIPDLKGPIAEAQKSIEVQEKIANRAQGVFKTDLKLSSISGKNTEEEIRLLEEKLKVTKEFNRANEEAIDNAAQRSAENQKNLATEAQALRKINDLRVKSLQSDLAFSNKLSSLSRQRVDLLAAQGKEDPSSFLQTQGIVRQFQQQKDNASLLAQVAGADPTNVEAGRRATEAAEALNNGYLQANLTLKKGLEDAERQAQKIGFSLTDAIGALGQAQNDFAQLGRTRTIDLGEGPSVFDANRSLRETAARLSKETGIQIAPRNPISGRLTARFARRQNDELIKAISGATALRNANQGVDDANRNKQISDETVENFKLAIASLNSEATPAMQKLATSVDNLAQKEWRIDIQVEGQPRLIREGTY